MNFKSLGIFLIIMGIGSWVLPLFDRQFVLFIIPMLLLGVSQTVNSILFIVVGIVLYYLGLKMDKSTTKK